MKTLKTSTFYFYVAFILAVMTYVEALPTYASALLLLCLGAYFKWCEIGPERFERQGTQDGAHPLRHR